MTSPLFSLLKFRLNSFPLLPDGFSFLLPQIEEKSHILHLMISVEQRSHAIQQILVVMQILLILNLIKLKPLPNRLILQSRIIR